MLLAAGLWLPFTLRALRTTPLGAATAAPTIAAGLLLAVHFATWITSLSFTSVAVSVALVSTTPLWVAAFAWLFLDRAPSRRLAIGTLVAVMGGAAIALGGGDGDARGSSGLMGEALAIVGAMAMGGYLLLGRSAQRRGLSAAAYVGVAYAVAAVALAPLPAAFGFAPLGYPAATLGWIALLAVVPQAIGHTGLNVAMRTMDPTRVATATLLEPIGAGALAALLYGEVPSPPALVGALVLLLGVAIAVRAQPAR
jgi:drug/metabolite transporter (DMT)-like permease